ncbi:hypothetical protein UMZ34_19810 [Halopseudomonas pachastrellae]|nr:hypothetical protein UMZ34_19810 [Halopseudomonas pachastrellae]
MGNAFRDLLALNVDIESIGGKGVERIDPPDFALAIGAKTMMK